MNARQASIRRKRNFDSSIRRAARLNVPTGGIDTMRTADSFGFKAGGGAEALTGGTVVSSNYEVYENHPLASAFGAFAEDPLWDDFVKAIEENRATSKANQPTED